MNWPEAFHQRRVWEGSAGKGGGEGGAKNTRLAFTCPAYYYYYEWADRLYFQLTCPCLNLWSNSRTFVSKSAAICSQNEAWLSWWREPRMHGSCLLRCLLCLLPSCVTDVRCMKHHQIPCYISWVGQPTNSRPASMQLLPWLEIYSTCVRIWVGHDNLYFPDCNQRSRYLDISLFIEFLFVSQRLISWDEEKIAVLGLTLIRKDFVSGYFRLPATGWLGSVTDVRRMI